MSNLKKLNQLKVGVLFALLFLSITISQANNLKNPYILSDDGLIDPRAVMKIDEIGKEVQTKTGVKIYLYAKDSYENIPEDLELKEKFEKIKEYEANIIKPLEGSFVVLTLSLQQTHINLFTSQDLNSIINKDEILDDYIIPLLASKDKNNLYSKVSAAVLNGYAQIADEIAKSKNITLESSIGSSGKTFGTIWRVFIYFIIVTGIAAYTIAVLRAKKR